MHELHHCDEVMVLVRYVSTYCTYMGTPRRQPLFTFVSADVIGDRTCRMSRRGDFVAQKESCLMHRGIKMIALVQCIYTMEVYCIDVAV